MNTDESLSKIFDVEVLPKEELLPTPTTEGIYTSDKIEDDYEKSRENLKSLLLSGQAALEHALEVAKQSEHPRAFEVVGNLIKQLADVNQQLMDIHQQKKKLVVITMMLLLEKIVKKIKIKFHNRHKQM